MLQRIVFPKVNFTHVGVSLESNGSVLYVQCGEWIHGRCARVNRVSPKFSRHFACSTFKGNVEDAVKQEEKLCHEVETVKVYHDSERRWKIQSCCDCQMWVG